MFEEFFLFHASILKAWKDRSIANKGSNDDHQFICQVRAGERLHKNYVSQTSFEKVLFQSPSGSIYGVNTVLDGFECNQLAKYKGKLDPSVIECALEQGIKLIEHLITL